MTDPREKLSTDPGIGPLDLGDTSATLVPLQALEELDPEIIGEEAYSEPKLLVAKSKIKPLEVETVKLAAEIDPRKQPTELSLPRTPPPPMAAVFDSGWPQAEVVLTTSQRPPAPPRRSRVPALLLAIVGAVLLVLGAHRVGRHIATLRNANTVAQPAHAALPVVLPHPTALVLPAPLVITAPTVSAPVTALASAAPSAVRASIAPNRHPIVKVTPLPVASSEALTVAPTAKPKRAIY